MPTDDLRTNNNRVASIEHVEPFASKASKCGKIVTVGSPKVFCSTIVQWGYNSSVGLTATALY